MACEACGAATIGGSRLCADCARSIERLPEMPGVPAGLGSLEIFLAQGRRASLGVKRVRNQPVLVVSQRGLGGGRPRSFSMTEGGWSEAWRDFAAADEVSAANYSRQVAEQAEQRERLRAVNAPRERLPMTSLQAPADGKGFVDLGLVTASAVMSQNVVADAESAITSFFGGSLTGVEVALDQALERARGRLSEAAGGLGADAVIGVTVSVSSTAYQGDRSQVVVLSGTAITTSPVREPEHPTTP